MAVKLPAEKSQFRFAARTALHQRVKVFELLPQRDFPAGNGGDFFPARRTRSRAGIRHAGQKTGWFCAGSYSSSVKYLSASRAASLLGLTLGTAAAGTEHIGIELDGKSEYAVVRRPFLADLLIFEQLLRRLLDNLL